MEPNEAGDEQLHELLHRNGWKTHHAKDLQQAFQLVVIERNDLILLDLDTPHLDIKAIQYLVQQSRVQHHSGERPIPVIALSDHTLPDDQEAQLSAAGIKYILEKPVDPEAVLVTLDEYYLESRIQDSKKS